MCVHYFLPQLVCGLILDFLKLGISLAQDASPERRSKVDEMKHFLPCWKAVAEMAQLIQDAIRRKGINEMIHDV